MEFLPGHGVVVQQGQRQELPGQWMGSMGVAILWRSSLVAAPWSTDVDNPGYFPPILGLF